MTSLALALAYLGMLALCLAMTRHHRAVFENAPSPGRKRVFRIAGAGLLLGTAVLNVQALGVAIGLIVGFTQVMLAGLAVSLTLAWQQRWVLPVGALLGLIGLLAAAAGG